MKKRRFLKLLKLSLLQSGDEDDSENLAQVLKDLRDSEAKLVSMLGETPEGKNGEERKVKGFFWCCLCFRCICCNCTDSFNIRCEFVPKTDNVTIRQGRVRVFQF